MRPGLDDRRNNFRTPQRIISGETLINQIAKLHTEKLLMVPLVSVVVVNFNGKHFLDRCLSALVRQTYTNFEVIVVDNASKDKSVEHLLTNYPWVKVVTNEKNLGFASGTNRGIIAAKGEFILTLNNDTQVERDFIEHLVEPMSEEDNGMCASKMLLIDGRINSTGICISRSGAAWDRGIFEFDTGKYDKKTEVLGPSAGAALYRKAMLEEIGLFDEEFFIYMEDVDLAVRGRLAGWMCTYAPKARVYHHHGGTAGYKSDLSIYYGNRNVLWYIIKDFPLRLLLTFLPFIVGRNLAVIAYYALRGQGRLVLRSKIDALKGLPCMLKKRKQVVRVAPMDKFIYSWARMEMH
jgi:GT2 family glycosyltransferase